MRVHDLFIKPVNECNNIYHMSQWCIKKIIGKLINEYIVDVVKDERPWMEDDDFIEELNKHVLCNIKHFSEVLIDKVSNIIASEQNEMEKAIKDLAHQLIDVKSELADLRTSLKLQEELPPIVDVDMTTHLRYGK